MITTQIAVRTLTVLAFTALGIACLLSYPQRPVTAFAVLLSLELPLLATQALWNKWLRRQKIALAVLLANIFGLAAVSAGLLGDTPRALIFFILAVASAYRAIRSLQKQRKQEGKGTECAGINRHVVGDERALQERRSDSILASSLAHVVARRQAKRRQRHRWAGRLSSEN